MIPLRALLITLLTCLWEGALNLESNPTILTSHPVRLSSLISHWLNSRSRPTAAQTSTCTVDPSSSPPRRKNASHSGDPARFRKSKFSGMLSNPTISPARAERLVGAGLGPVPMPPRAFRLGRRRADYRVVVGLESQSTKTWVVLHEGNSGINGLASRRETTGSSNRSGQAVSQPKTSLDALTGRDYP